MKHWPKEASEYFKKKYRYLKFIEECIKRNGQPKSVDDKKEGFDIHHIRPLSENGTNESSNLVYLTRAEHQAAHALHMLMVPSHYKGKKEPFKDNEKKKLNPTNS